MSCSCKHNQSAINQAYATLDVFRELFIKRMTVDSDHDDRRRRDFNQAIFGWTDEKDKVPEKTYQIWSEMDMEMVLQCFDDAVKDYRRTWCDNAKCRSK